MVFQAKAEPAAMDELHRTLSLADEVLRHKVLRIPESVYGNLGRAPACRTPREEVHHGRQHDHHRREPDPRPRDPLHHRRRRQGDVRRRREPALAEPPDQEWEEQTSFFNVVCWREMAENVSESLGKGSRVVVTGRLEQRSWETENGEKRSVVEIVADEIGPSLRWATAQITRNERRGGGDFGGGGGGGGGGTGGGGGGAAAAVIRAGGRRGARRRATTASDFGAGAVR